MRARRHASRRRQRAFTLLELLLASALLAVLMTGILAVVTDLGRSELALQRHRTTPEEDPPAADLPPEDPALDAWLRLLQDDLAHARTVVSARENELALLGYSALQPGQGQRTHRPVRIEYTFEEIDHRRWLVRRQALLDLPTNQNTQRDLVCSGIQRFLISRVVETPPTTARASVAGTLAPATAPAPAPLGSHWRLRVWAPTQDAPCFDQVLSSQAGGNS